MANKVINITGALHAIGTFPVDDRFILTKAQMKTINEDVFPDQYFCVCPEDHKFYIFDYNYDFLETTGKFRPIDDYLSFESAAAKEAFERAILGSETIEELLTKVGDEESGLIKDVSDVKADVVEIQGDVTNLKVDVAQLEEDVQGDDGLLKRVQAAEATLSNIETRLPVAEAKLVEIEERLDALTLENIPGTLNGGVVTL